MGLARDIDLTADSAVRGQRTGFGRSGHSRQRLETWQELPEKRDFLLHSLIAVARQRQAGYEYLFRIESKLHTLQREKAAHEKPRADQQHHREGDLHHNQRAAQAAMTRTARPFGGVLQRFMRVDTAGMQSGS